MITKLLYFTNHMILERLSIVYKYDKFHETKNYILSFVAMFYLWKNIIITLQN